MSGLNALRWVMSTLGSGDEVPRRVEGGDDAYCVHGLPLDEECAECAEEAEYEGEEAG